MSLVKAQFAEMVVSRQPSNQAANLVPGHTGQQLHVSGVFIVVLEIALVLENLLPILVVVIWLPAPARGVGDRLIAAFSVTCILSALVPTPLGLASYFSGGWYGGAPTCTTYQVTSIWCNLLSLALLTYMCVNCHFAVWRLTKIKPSSQRPSSSHRGVGQPLSTQFHGGYSPPSSLPSSLLMSPELPMSSQNSSVPTQKSDQHSERNGPVFSKCFTNEQKSEQVASVSINDESVQIQNNSRFRQLDKMTSQNKEYSQHQNSISSSPFHSKVLNNDTQVDPETEVSSETSPSKKTTETKRLGHELHVRLEEDLGFIKHEDYTIFQADQFNITNTNSNSNYQSKFAHNFFLPINSIARSSLKNKGYSSEYGRIENGMDNSLDVPVSTLNGSNSGLDCLEGLGGEEVSAKGCFCTQARDYVSLMLFLLFSCTLAISSLPVVGFGPRSTHSEKSCRSWLVPIPVSGRERTFYVTFLLFVYICLALGCSSGVSVCLQVSNRMKRERKRRSRLYHEEENVPDIVELSVLDGMKRQYSLACVVMAGLLTWLPILVMLTLQKAGVQVSEATLMYSNIATSLPGLLNPLLYSLALAKYRAGYKAIMEKCCFKRKQNKAHRLVRVHTQGHVADDEVSTDTALDTTTSGHTCIHGRANPNHDSSTDVNVKDYDDDNDDDGFPDDSELTEEEKKGQTVVPSERTPLQATLVSAPSIGSFKTVLANRAKSPWQRDSFCSSNDNECLLVSSSDCVDEETGL